MCIELEGPGVPEPKGKLLPSVNQKNFHLLNRSKNYLVTHYHEKWWMDFLTEMNRILSLPLVRSSRGSEIVALADNSLSEAEEGVNERG